MLSVVYRQAARRDIVRAAQAYEIERCGLARRFVEEVARIERHIIDAPALYQIVDGEIRRAVMRRFPFGLFYVEEADRIVVLACLDLRRDPLMLTDVLARR